MKKLLLVCATAALTTLSYAQQDIQLTQWQFDRLSFNPAVAGVDRMHSATLFHRDQWDGFDRDPKTYLFNYHGMFGEKQNIGGGLTFYSEVLGQQTNTSVQLKPSYHLNLDGSNFLSGGLSVGIYSSKFGHDWRAIDMDDNVVRGLIGNNQSQTAFDVGLGFMLYQPNKYYIGISATHLNAAKLQKLYTELSRHVYVMGGYELPLGNSDFVLRPNALVKTDLANVQFDINADVLWNQMLWGGLAFRPGDAIAPYVGFQKAFASKQISATRTAESSLRIGYAYDITTSEIKNYSAGSHEIFLTYCVGFGNIPIKAKYSNPRFL